MAEVLRESHHQVLVTLDDAAGQLGVSVKTLRRLVDRRAVPAYRFGKAIRVNVAEVLEATKQEPSKPCPSSSEAKPFTSTSRSPAGGDSSSLLRLLIAKQRRSCTTN
jgi:excisionase family DNA binding protein